MVRRTLKEVFYDQTKVTDEKVLAYYRPLCTPNALGALIQTARSLRPDVSEQVVRAAKDNPTETLIIWGRE